MKEKVVALRYDQSLPAPFILAKGKGYQAERIRDLAEKYSIPCVEQPFAAETLFSFDPGQMIPESMYEIVAELLVFVSGLRERSEQS